jgi:hypothetical protein
MVWFVIHVPRAGAALVVDDACVPLNAGVARLPFVRFVAKRNASPTNAGLASEFLTHFK